MLAGVSSPDAIAAHMLVDSTIYRQLVATRFGEKLLYPTSPQSMSAAAAKSSDGSNSHGDFVDLFSFLSQYHWIHDLHLTRFLESEVWNSMPPEWIAAFSAMSTEELNQLPFHNSGPEESTDTPTNRPSRDSLTTFLHEACSLSQPRQQHQWVQRDVPPPVQVSGGLRKGMSPKKLHEVERMASLVHQVVVESGCNLVVDVGSGLGYLGQVLHETYGLSVLGLESSEGHSDGAERRAAKQGLRCSGIRSVPFLITQDDGNVQEFCRLIRDIAASIQPCQHSVTTSRLPCQHHHVLASQPFQHRSAEEFVHCGDIVSSSNARQHDSAEKRCHHGDTVSSNRPCQHSSTEKICQHGNIVSSKKVSDHSRVSQAPNETEEAGSWRCCPVSGQSNSAHCAHRSYWERVTRDTADAVRLSELAFSTRKETDRETESQDCQESWTGRSCQQGHRPEQGMTGQHGQVKDAQSVSYEPTTKTFAEVSPYPPLSAQHDYSFPVSTDLSFSSLASSPFSQESVRVSPTQAKDLAEPVTSNLSKLLETDSSDPKSVSPTQAKDVAEPVTSNPKDRAEQVTSNPKDLPEPVTSNPKDRAEPVTSNPKDLPELVTSNPKDLPEPVTSNPKDRAEPVTSNPKDRAEPVTSNPKDRAEPVTSNLEDRAEPVTSNPKDRAEPVTSNPKDRAEPVTSNPKDRAEPVTSSLSRLVEADSSDPNKVSHEGLIDQNPPRQLVSPSTGTYNVVSGMSPESTHSKRRKDVVAEERAGSCCGCEPMKGHDEFSEKRGRAVEDVRVCLIGLHCCGDLTPAMLRLYCDVPFLRALCCVSCCYHKMQLQAGSEERFVNFPMSVAAKTAYSKVCANRTSSLSTSMSPLSPCASSSASSESSGATEIFLTPCSLRLAAQETRMRWAAQTEEDHADHTRHVAFRALLQLFFKNTGQIASDRKSMRKLDYTTFDNFVQSYINATNMQEDERMQSTQTTLKMLYDQYKEHFKHIEPYTVALQPVLEWTVLGDRQRWLAERGLTSDLLPVFDEVVSPRNLALVSVKAPS